MTSKEEFLAGLRAEVVDAQAAKAAGRRVDAVTRLAAAAVVVAVAVVAFVVVSPSPAHAGVDVTRIGDDLVIRLTDLETHPDEIVDAAREAGLDVVVDQVPVGPSNVGRFVGDTQRGDYPEELRSVDSDGASTFVGFRIPHDYSGELRLRLGRPAEVGEEWVVSSQAVAPGELLACSDVVGRSLAEVVPALPEGVNVQILVIDDGTVVPDVAAVGADERLGGLQVARAMNASPTDLWLEVAADPAIYLLPAPEGC